MRQNVVYVDDREFQAALNRLAHSGGDLRPVFSQVRQDMREDVQAHFEARRGPDGAWARPDPDYLRRRTEFRGSKYKRGKRKGQLTRRGQRREAGLGGLGRLKSLGVYVFEITQTSITMMLRPELRWAEIHQRGGSVGRRAQVPARPFLWASEQLQRKFVDAVKRRLIEAWGL